MTYLRLKQLKGSSDLGNVNLANLILVWKINAQMYSIIIIGVIFTTSSIILYA